MSAAKVYKFHLEFTIANSQLVWSKHAKERLLQRGVKMPDKYGRWDLIEKRFNVEHNCFTMNLRLERRGHQDLVIVVSRQLDGKYKVITTYWDDQQDVAV